MIYDIISKKPGIKEKLHQELRDKGYVAFSQRATVRLFPATTQ